VSDKSLGVTGQLSPRDDHAIPFHVEALDVRGRAVRLGAMLDNLLDRHDYPEPVANLVAEAIVLTVLLGTSLKFEGKFILQTQSDGPVDMLVADLKTPGSMRAYARFDESRLAAAIAAGRTSPEDLLGKGVLAMTIDQGPNTQRYQGIVQLDGSSLEDIARAYFRQSEQLPSEVRLAVAKLITNENGHFVEKWRAGGLMAQFLPETSDRMRLPDLPSGNDEADAEAAEYDPTDDAWIELMALVGTIEPSELLDPSISNERLLYRLFHEHGVRVFEGQDVVDDCSCSRERIKSILEGFTAEEVTESTENGKIHVKCEFCSKSYEFDPGELG
jgi:molecular chaperone Hsp33